MDVSETIEKRSGIGHGTPGPGRPKGCLDKRVIAGRKMAQALASEAWDVVEEFLADGVRRIADGKELFLPNDPRLRLDAAKLVIEYAHGKPRQTVSIEDLRESAEEVALGYGLSKSDFDEVIGIAEQIAAKDALPS